MGAQSTFSCLKCTSSSFAAIKQYRHIVAWHSAAKPNVSMITVTLLMIAAVRVSTHVLLKKPGLLSLQKKKSDSCGRRVFCLTETWLAIPSAVAMHFIPGIYTCFVSSLLRLYRFLVRTATASEASNFLIFLPCETAWCSFFRWILNCSNSLVVSVEEPV